MEECSCFTGCLQEKICLCCAIQPIMPTPPIIPVEEVIMEKILFGSFPFRLILIPQKAVLSLPFWS